MEGKLSLTLATVVDDVEEAATMVSSHSNCLKHDASGDSGIRMVFSDNTHYRWTNSFEDLNLSPQLVKGIYLEMKFKKLTNIQAKILPMIMKPPHKHLIAQAPYRSGKTTSFVLGMLNRIDTTLRQPQALCIFPTKELAKQNMELVQKMAKFTAITAQLLVPEARRGVRFAIGALVSEHVVIGTPATLKKWIVLKKLNLSHLKIIVFDDADHMLAMDDGFREDSVKMMKGIEKANSKFQVLLFAATLNEHVKDFAARIVKDPNQLFVDSVIHPKDQDNIDAFYCLPDAIICHILSFLPTKIAASTSVLSRRWRYLLASVPVLDFDDSVYLHPEKRGLTAWCLGPGRRGVLYMNGKWCMRSTSFIHLVDRVLALHCHSMLQKFSLKTTDCYDPMDPDCVISWIHKVLALGVSDLYLVADWVSSVHFLLPSHIFSSKTLVRLSIKNVGKPSTIDVEDFHLPKLKTLHLESVLFAKEDIGFSKLLAGCKALEELSLECIHSSVWKSCSVSVTTLKRLTFGPDKSFQNPSSVSFDTPNLVYLEYTEFNACKYPKVNFDSLVEARIDLQMTSYQEKKAAEASSSELSSEDIYLFGNSTDFVKGLCNVQSLFLSASTLEVLTFCCKEIPIFRNLTHLTIKSRRIFGWESLPGLLKSCPNLETLVFEGLLHRCGDVCFCKSSKEDNVTWLSTSPVKVIKVLVFDDNIEKHIEQVNHFLETMPNLEQFVLYYEASFDLDLVEMSSSHLQKLTKVASPKCKIQLIPSNLSKRPIL